VLVLLLLGAAAMIYVPMLLQPARQGGDMIGLAFAGIAVVTTIALLVGSAAALLIAWRPLRATGR